MHSTTGKRKKTVINHASARTWGWVLILLGIGSGFGSPLLAQSVPHAAGGGWSGISHVILPQARAFALDAGRDPIQIERIEARVEILEQAAITTLDISLRNASSSPAEAVLLLPVPDRAAVHSFLFDGASSAPTARVLPRDEARATYDAIVARIKDPALLEFAGYNLIRSSVFPVPAHGTQRVRLAYDHILLADGGRIDYALPRSESLSVMSPWGIDVDIRSKSSIAMIYSPSHDIVTTLREPKHVALRISEPRASHPGSFRLSYLLEQGGVSASLIAHPDPEAGGGYFLLMAGLPVALPDSAPAMRREVTIVLDRSGSMAGPKLDQARAAALQVIEGLEPGEDFNIVDYSSQVSSFAARAVTKDTGAIHAARRYLDSLRAIGGTNIEGALVEALRPQPRAGVLPIILFLTDGLPTVGRTSEVAIRELVENRNPHGRRIFTFGVGNDVNVPLLDRIADVTRGTSTYVLANEDVELKVAQVFRRLSGPVLADLALATLDERGAVTTRAVRDLEPTKLPDLYAGDQLVVLGRYVTNEPLDFRLTGTLRGVRRTFAFRFAVSSPSTSNAFVPRLWASRRIAVLIDQIRQAGAELMGGPVQVGRSLFEDPRFKELADEILRLSTRFGVLSEYTAFLATEGTNLANWEAMSRACTSELDNKAVRTRSGAGAVNQGLNYNERKGQVQLDYKNGYWDANQSRVEVTNVQQVSDRAFFKRGSQWIDSRLVAQSAGAGNASIANVELAPPRVIAFGSAEHGAIVNRFVVEGRQGILSLSGEILMELGGERVLIQNR